jgi:N-acetylneuraminate epimerase
VIRLPAILLMTTLAAAAETLTWNQLPPIPDPIGVAAPFAGVSGGALLVAGGANFPGQMPWEGGKKVWHDRAWVLEKPDGEWRAAGKLPRALGYGVSVSHGDGIVCVGGSDSERHHAESFRLVWKNGGLTTQPLPPLPIALSGAGGALLGDTLIVACGSEEPGEQTATNRAFALDLAAAKPAWRELPPLPAAARLLTVAAAHDGAFHIFGGAALAPDAAGKIARTYLREAWSYRADQGWQRLADLPKPCVAAPSPAPFIAGKLLLLAGDDGSLAGFAPVEKHPGFPGGILAYEPALDRWSEAGRVPAPRATVPVVEWRGAFIIPSGEARPGVRSPEVWGVSGR